MARLDKRDNTRALTLSALFAALSTISLYIASIWPTGKIGIVALSSIFVAASICEATPLHGFYVYIATGLLGALLLPDKSGPILYAAFFGYYPIAKYFFERARSMIVSWILKLLLFNMALSGIWFFLRGLVFHFEAEPPGLLLIYLGGNVVFTLFDYGYTKVLRFYMGAISKRAHASGERWFGKRG